MLLHWTVKYFVIALLFLERTSAQITISKSQGVKESRSISNNGSRKGESSSIAQGGLHTSLSLPSSQNYANETAFSNANKENCSNEHTFLVTLLYNTKKTVSSCFRYILINENFCRKRYPKTFVIAIVHSHPKNFKRRNLIRRTWANNELYEKFNLATVFAVGEDPEHPSVQITLEREWEIYEDIIQFSFHDTYRNLTLKAISWLNWAATYCSNASYILKADDDMFVNIFGIMRFLRKQHVLHPSITAFYCSVWTTMKPYRDKTNRWYVSYEEYNETVYPRYCSGSSYCLTMRAVQPLLDSVKSSPFLWVDDAYITGVLANVANVQRIDTQSLYKFSYEEINKNFFHNPFIFLHLPRTLNRRYAFWKKTLELCNMEDCSR